MNPGNIGYFFAKGSVIVLLLTSENPSTASGVKHEKIL